jgi:outer membrane receptor protein involved in Fe transport
MICEPALRASILHADRMFMVWSRMHLGCFWQYAALFVLVLLTASAPSWCQSGDQGSLGGVAFDTSGAVVAGAQVKVRNISTSFAASTTTDDHGLFRFAVLPIGLYELTANQAGFATVQVNDIDLTVGATLTFTLRFIVASGKEAVTVTDEAPILEKSRSQLSATIDNRFISNLPVNGRDFTAFVLLTPGVSSDVRGGLSFAGQRAMNSLLLDGINNDDPFWGQPTGATGYLADGRQPYYISQDAVREFQVNSNAYSAEFGRAAGGVINTITKSGTNDFHGSAFWFYRDKSMNANDPINKLHGLPKSPFHFNQFGGTLGGPVRKDRLFFFVNYEGLRSNIPNAVFLNLPAGFQPNPDPTIAGFQQIALDYLKPRAASWVWSLTQNNYLGKIDWQTSEKHRLTAFLDVQRFEGGGGLDVGSQNSFEHTRSNSARVETGTVSLTSAISNRTVNVARFGYLHGSIGFGPVGTNPEANVFQSGQKVLTIGRGTGAPQENPYRQFQWSDTLHHDRGPHALKFGSDVLVDRVRFFFAQNFSGSYDFGSLESFGRSLSGQPQPLPSDDYTQTFSGFGEHGIVTRPNFTSVAGFVEDQWRIRPTLTLNLGLRYDLQVIDKPPVRNPSPALLAAGLDTSTLPIDKHNLAPRIGIAWSPTLDSHVVVRAGYGIFYALTPSVLTSRADFQNGISTQTRTFGGNSPPLASLIPTYPNTLCGPPDPSGLPPNCRPPNAVAGLPTLQLFSAHYRQPYVQQGSLGLEVLASKDLTVSASYIFSKGTHLQQIRDVNLGNTVSKTIAVADTGALLSYRAFERPRPISDFNRILVFNSDANSIFHGLAIQLNKRFSRNWQALSSYTLSKVIDNNPNVFALNPGAGNPDLVQDPMAPRLDRGPGGDDQRHRFTFAGVWTPSYGKVLPWAGRAVLQGWEISGILTVQSGRPYSGLINFDLNNDGDFGTDRTPELGRNTFYMPATVYLDPRLTRNISIVERAKLHITVEGFNVLNHTNITRVNNNQYAVSGFSGSASVCGTAPSSCLVPQKEGLSAFGTPTATSGARTMQIAMRLTF